MNNTAIETKQLPLHDIFRDNFAFVIPAYQRPYAWEEEQVQELFDDLYDFFESTRGTESIYFLGCIVVVHGKGKEAEVVDGQQRLTTLTMLLAALRTRVPTAEKDDITAYLYEKGNKFAGTPNRYRLCLRERDRTFFQAYIQDSDGIARLLTVEPAQLANDAQQRLFHNMRYFMERVRALSPTQASDFAAFIIQRCYIVMVAALERDSAYRIFSVLNDRGLDLSPVDILKAEIIGALAEADRPQYTQQWEDIETNLGRDGFTELFAHIRMLAVKARPRETLLKEFRTAVLLDGQQQPRDARRVIDEAIAPHAQAFTIIRNGTYQSTQDAPAINDLFVWLNLIDNADWTPAAIYYLTKHMAEPAALLAFFTRLERLAASMMIRHVTFSKRVERYRALLTAIQRGDEATIAGVMALTLDERHYTRTSLDSEIYRSHAARYALLRLDALLGDGAATYAHPVLSIEHVLPQKIPADSTWAKTFPDPEWNAANVHRLGNLVLLTKRKNAMAFNFDFATKKAKYFTGRNGVSTCALTTQVLNEPDWTPEVLLRRQQHLLTMLSALWQL